MSEVIRVWLGIWLILFLAIIWGLTKPIAWFHNKVDDCGENVVGWTFD